MESTRRSGADDRTDTPDYPQIISKWNRVVLFLLIPLLASTVLYKTVMEFDSDDYPDDYLNHSITVPDYNRNVFNVLQKIGDGFLPGPEDLAYDSETSFLYTSCVDGWIKRIKLDDESLHVENWTFVGGRPLGLAFGSESDQRRLLYVANAYKGLMVVDSDGKTVNLLADEADDGVKFRLTDGVDVASDGMVYFTDASFKYNLADHVLDLIEGRPYGRLLRYDPNTKQTQVLLHDLYFANGVAISHDQTSVIFCESSLRRCSNYHIHGSRAGTVDRFITDLPGFVDNIRYDGDGRYWIAIASSIPFMKIWKYRLFRNLLAFFEKKEIRFLSASNGGLMEVNLKGEPVKFYTDARLKHVTGGIKIGNHLYFGNLVDTYMGRIQFNKPTD